MRVKKQQLEPDMEQWIDSKLGKDVYKKAVYCNYAASLRANKMAHDLGYSCEFYLDAREQSLVPCLVLTVAS